MTKLGIIGQDAPFTQLVADFESSKMAHAYLFYGPSGVGKKMVAKLIFRLANGHSSECRCSFCKTVENESHPDLKVIAPDGKFIKVEQARDTRHFLQMLPVDSKIKMVIIDEAQEFNTESANALLKTLEEPPENSLLILVTSIPERLLLTIRSRCRQIRFNPILPKDITGYLKERMGLDEEKAVLTASLSGGIFSKALAIAKEPAFWDNREETIETALKIPFLEAGECFSLASSLVEKAGAKKQEGQKISEVKVRFLKDFLSSVQSVYRDALALKETGDEKLLVNKDRLVQIRERFSGVATPALVGYIEKIEEAKKQLQYNVNPQLTLQSLFLNMEGK